MDIRLATKNDISSIIMLLQQVNDVHAIGRPDLFKLGTTKYNKEDLEVILEAGETKVYLACEEDKVLGHVFFNIEETEESESRVGHKTAYIDDICVDEKARGQRVGEALYEEVKRLAKEMGCDRVTLHVWECNPGALAFYEKLGMKEMYRAMEANL